MLSERSSRTSSPSRSGSLRKRSHRSQPTRSSRSATVKKTSRVRKRSTNQSDCAVRTTAVVAPQKKTKTVSSRHRSHSTTVSTVEIRPSGTVFSRRSNAKREAIHHLPEHPPVDLTPPAWMQEECQVGPAQAGDQTEILQLLSGLPSPPSRAEFHAAVDHPEHDSANRLVARLAGRIVGHIEIAPRTIMIGSAPVKAAVLDRIAILPECRGAGHGQRLVQAAEQRMRELGVVAAFSRTRIATSFHELGWSVLGRDCASPGRPADILARLLAKQEREGPEVTMRQWRHVELPAILRIYNQNADRFVGTTARSEAYARWLVSRRAFDSIIVALQGNDRYDLHETTAKIVGYCIQTGGRVLEVMADPEYRGLEREILARVCAEAIENDRQELIYESSPTDPLHGEVRGPACEGEEAAVTSRVAPQDRMIVARIFDPQGLLETMAPTLAHRVVEAGIRDTVELGFDSDTFRGSVTIPSASGDKPREASIQPGRVGRSYLKLADDEFTRLVLGQCDPLEATTAGRLEPSTQLSQKLAEQLFPRLPLWCPMWDDVPS
ncbi:MAG: GNAT family N-acetyltransferase [Planctomycetaceae bacterium]|nr:GNAT family N-acetyltransferase [Planctomycetaceae bacterium]